MSVVSTTPNDLAWTPVSMVVFQIKVPFLQLFEPSATGSSAYSIWVYCINNFKSWDAVKPFQNVYNIAYLIHSLSQDMSTNKEKQFIY